MTTRTFLDSGVLIDAFRGTPALAAPVIHILNDPDRVFLTSELVRLEVLPKALFHRHAVEARFYQQFLDSVEAEARITSVTVEQAFSLAVRWNLNAIDALHVAAALQIGADELITTEGPTSPLVRVTALTVTSVRR